MLSTNGVLFMGCNNLLNFAFWGAFGYFGGFGVCAHIHMLMLCIQVKDRCRCELYRIHKQKITNISEPVSYRIIIQLYVQFHHVSISDFTDGVKDQRFWRSYFLFSVFLYEIRHFFNFCR